MREQLNLENALLLSGFLFLFAALGVGIIRLYLGPHLAERAVALGKISLVVISLLAGAAISFQDPLHLELAFILSLVGFLSAITIARFLIHTKSK